MKENKRIFDAQDLDILCHAVALTPNIEFAAYATKLAKQYSNFPIETHNELVSLLEYLNNTKYVKRQITKDLIVKFFPKQLFPIENCEDFLGKIIIGLSWGDTYHYHEDMISGKNSYTTLNQIRNF